MSVTAFSMVKPAELQAFVSKTITDEPEFKRPRKTFIVSTTDDPVMIGKRIAKALESDEDRTFEGPLGDTKVTKVDLDPVSLAAVVQYAKEKEVAKKNTPR